MYKAGDGVRAHRDGGAPSMSRSSRPPFAGLLIKVPDAQLAAVNLTRDDFHGE
jgi:hypothetical protein